MSKLLSSEHLPAVTGIDARQFQGWCKRGLFADDFGRRLGRGRAVLFDPAECLFLRLLGHLSAERKTLESCATETAELWRDLIQWAHDGGTGLLQSVVATGAKHRSEITIRIPAGRDAADWTSALADAIAHAAADLAEHGDTLVAIEVLDLSALAHTTKEAFDRLARDADDDVAEADEQAAVRAVA